MTYPDDPVARVLALVNGEGYSIRSAARRENVPTTTAWEWVQKANASEQGNKPILDRWQRKVARSLDLMDIGLDIIQEDDSGLLALKNLTTLNIIAGTGTDKLQKEKEQSQPRDLAQLVIIINAQEPPQDEPVIEGEIIDAVQGL